MVSDSSLSAFIASNPDARELKRALAVQMTLLGLKQGVIQAILGGAVELHQYVEEALSSGRSRLLWLRL